MTELANHEATTAEVDQLVLCLFAMIADRLENATDAFLTVDQEQASRLIAGDGEFQTLQEEVEELVETELALRRLDTDIGLVARFYERLGDHAVNVTRRIPASVARVA